MYSEVVPGLCLGDLKDATHHSREFQAVINCTKDFPFYALECPWRTRVPLDDDVRENGRLLALLPWVVDEIAKHLAAGRRVLVHCWAGRQRSAAVVAAFLVGSGRSLDEAVALVRAARPEAFLPYMTFEEALGEFLKQTKK